MRLAILLALVLAAAAKHHDACSHFNATECTLHADECSLCTIKLGKKEGKALCFRYNISGFLPPQIFDCTPAPAAPEPPSGGENPIPVDVCEAFSPAECTQHADECSLCKLRFGPTKPDLCFRYSIAEALPPQIFDCSPRPKESLAALEKPKPVVCEMLTPAECADHDDKCSLCKSSFTKKKLCFEHKIAKGLPPQIFKCKPTPEANELDGAKPKPVPDICEMFNSTECADHADKCSLCKNNFEPSDPGLCFDYNISRMLPPAIFDCSAAPEEPLAALEKPKPTICEMLSPAECPDHDDKCSLCKSTFSGLELCFDQEIAKGLPPQIFKCKPLPPAAEVTTTAASVTVCEALTATECADHSNKCSLCKNNFAPEMPGLCFDFKISKALPPQVFDCSPAPAASLAQSENPMPVICEMYSPDECSKHFDQCSICRNKFTDVELCFDQEIAVTLPHQVFKCKPTPEANELADANPKPVPDICEMFNATVCADHADKCSLCKNKLKPTAAGLCFDYNISKALPPAIFDCSAAPEESLAELEKPKPVVCEMLTPAECADHDDKCSLCKSSFTKDKLCFEHKIAKGLPPQIFKCKPTPKDLELADANPEPKHDSCKMFNATECADHADKCSLCKNKFKPTKPPLCLKYNASKMLPPMIFDCTAAPEEVLAAAPEKKPKPTICEMLKPAECADHDDKCSLCKSSLFKKELCFDQKIAKGLPKSIFDCSPETQDQAAVESLLPIPDICEMFNATECADHADKCSLCESTFSKMQVCFEQSIAKSMPPQIFKCTASPEPPTLELGAENDDGCYILENEDDCDSVPGCVWCHSSEAPSACYFEEKAKRLPAAFFQCHMPAALSVA